MAGNVVSGAGNTTVDPVGLNDSNGTIQLNGTFQSSSFSATTAYPLDGVPPGRGLAAAATDDRTDPAYRDHTPTTAHPHLCIS